MCAWRVVDPVQLGTFDLFSRLDVSQLEAVARLVSVRAYQRNELIVAEGLPGDRLFLVQTGAGRVSKEIPGVGEEALAIIPAGAYFGEMALFGDSVRSADVYADRRSTLFVIRIDDLNDLLETRPDIAVPFLWGCSATLADRVRAANAKVAFLSAAAQFS